MPIWRKYIFLFIKNKLINRSEDTEKFKSSLVDSGNC